MKEPVLIRTVIQRTSFAEVKINNNSQGQFQKGLLILFGVGFSEEENLSTEEKNEVYELDETILLKKIQPKLEKLSNKVLSLRIFSDDQGKMNLSVKDIAGSIYVISQFTLFADCTKGNRPSFTNALKPNLANLIYEKFISLLRMNNPDIKIYTGKFGEEMQVSLCNDGPVTLILEETA